MSPMEFSEHLHQELDKLETKLDLSFQNMGEKIDMLFGMHSEMIAEVKELRCCVARHDRILDGNGQEGLVARLTKIDTTLHSLEKSLDEEATSRRRLWGGVWMLASGVLISVIAGIILFNLR